MQNRHNSHSRFNNQNNNNTNRGYRNNHNHRRHSSDQNKRQGAIIDDDGFQLVQRRKRRGIMGRSTTQVMGLQGAPPPIKEIFVSRVLTGNEYNMKTFLNDNNIQVHEIEKVSHPDSKFNFFKIAISSLDISSVLDESFWPGGICCKTWGYSRVNSNVSNYDSDYENDGYIS